MMAIPTATAEQMAQVDRIMMDELGVDVLQLMEAAGIAVAEAARRRLGGDVSGKRVLLLAGSGGNGGDALVAARHLLSWGAIPQVMLSKPAADLPQTTAHQERATRSVGILVHTMPDDAAVFDDEYDLVIDGLLGFSGKGNPRGIIAEMIRIANAHPAPILAIDLPSGLDATAGTVGDPCIDAAATIALVLPKAGFTTLEANPHCGEIEVATIGVPATVLAQAGLAVPPDLFARAGWLPWHLDTSA